MLMYILVTGPWKHTTGMEMYKTLVHTKGSRNRQCEDV